MPWWSLSAPVQHAAVLCVAWALGRVLPDEITAASEWLAARSWCVQLGLALGWMAALSLPLFGAVPGALGLAVLLRVPADAMGLGPVLGLGVGGAPGAVVGWWWSSSARGRAAESAVAVRFGRGITLGVVYALVLAGLAAAIFD